MQDFNYDEFWSRRHNSSLPAHLRNWEWECPKCAHTWTTGIERCFVCSTARPGSSAATKDVKPMDDIKVMGSLLPSSLSYLHALAANGQGDLYDWDKGVISINICLADSTRETSLKEVDHVELIYKDIKTEAK